MTVQCCICKEVKVDDEWIRTRPDEPVKNVSHSYCPRCLHGTVRGMQSEIVMANRAQPAVT